MHQSGAVPRRLGVVDADGYDGLGAQVSDPASAVFSPTGSPLAAPYGSTTGSMTVDRSFHTTILLNNGRVLITGGIQDDIVTEGWTPIASVKVYTPDSVVPAPVLFSLSVDGNGPGAIWHSSTGAVVSASNPAIAGEALSMFTSNPASNGAIPPQIVVGDQISKLLYFGFAPGYPGYFQLNFLVPSGLHASDVPVREIPLSRSDEITTSVQ